MMLKKNCIMSEGDSTLTFRIWLNARDPPPPPPPPHQTFWLQACMGTVSVAVPIRTCACISLLCTHKYVYVHVPLAATHCYDTYCLRNFVYTHTCSRLMTRTLVTIHNKTHRGLMVRRWYSHYSSVMPGPL